ncbi:Down syndrome cell adhesion molecule-like protein Dscam2 [Gryllus bimaculatus]|nr:Down syndrome cell adhesion molecule-like protein Dscam2 [Gryllus bimaculatus]
MQPGPSVSLKCIAAGNPTPHFSWTLDGFPLPTSDRLLIGQYVTAHGDVISHVNVSSVRVEDGGEYRCVASNRVGFAAHAARLNIYGLPHVRPMSTIGAVAGKDLIIKCPVAGFPISSIIWEKDGQQLPVNRRQEVSANGTLTVRNVVDSDSDRGVYTCTARNKQGHEDSKSVTVEVKVPPKIEPFSFPANIQEGARVHVTCVVSEGDSPLKIEWLKDGRALAAEDAASISTYQIGDYDLALRLVSAAPDHNGNYTCVATNEAASTSYTALLLVHGNPVISAVFIAAASSPSPKKRKKILLSSDSDSTCLILPVPPRIAPFSFNNDLSEGVRAHVTCFIEKGDPPFDITWLKDSDPIPPGNDQEPGSETKGLKIIPIDVEQMSLIAVPPRWLVEPQNQQAAEGVLHFVVHCQAEGFPPPTITWRRATGKRPGDYRDLDMDPSSGITVHNNGSLMIQRLQEEHEGHYLCEATNGIGNDLSKVIYLTVNAPAHFLVKSKNQTSRMGASINLQCEAYGDKPLQIIWRKAGLTLDPAAIDYRYNKKEVNITGGIASELGISKPPDFPRNLHVIEKGSRFVKLGWILSQDGNSPITHYTVEYKTDSDIWHEYTAQTTVPGGQATTQVTGLRPATNYQFRLYAENELGRSQASDVLDVITDGETPGGPPQNVQVEATSSTELHVTWDPPEHYLWNGEILGYHVGYKELRSNNEQYQYKRVENRGQGGDCLLSDLKKFTRYSIVVQAYNALGQGPMAQEVVGVTMEDVPSGPPQDVRCTAFTSQSLQISWEAPPDAQLHGILNGYKVIWENLEDYDSISKPETKITTALTVVVHGLEKFTNYSIQVLAFTRVGDGVSSPSLFCMTEEDGLYYFITNANKMLVNTVSNLFYIFHVVPEAPAGIKAVVSSSTSIIVSWLPPKHSNGIITTYNLQVRLLDNSGQEIKTFPKNLPPVSNHYEIESLNKRGRYEFSVAALTRVGEGPFTQPLVLSPSSEVQAAIYSFDSVIVVPRKQNTQLPCKHVGKPDPTVSWRQMSQQLKLSARLKVQSDGSLQIADLREEDNGNYTCHVENTYGSDRISHKLIVQVPPSAPLLHATGSTSTSLNVQWKLGEDGGAPITGFVLHYKREFGEWEEVKVNRKQSSYIINNLWCGTSYQLYVTAHNAIGMGHPSEYIIATTDGGKPGTVPADKFLYVNSTSVTMYLENWVDGGCPISYFEVEYKPSNSIELQKSFVIRGLQPDTDYQLRVKARNNAGITSAEYAFHTISNLGGTASPTSNRVGGTDDVSLYLDFKLIILLALSASILLLAVVVYYCFQKRPFAGEVASLHESQTAAALDNKQNMEQREQYYATVRKPLRSPVHEMATLERIPEYSEDIYPYATFQLNEAAGVETRCTSAAPAPASTQLQTFMYHDPHLSTAETLQIRESDSDPYSKVRARSRRKSKSFKSESEEYDTLGSDSDTEQGTSSRTESSNHLDDPGPGHCKDRSASQQLSRHRSRVQIHQQPVTSFESRFLNALAFQNSLGLQDQGPRQLDHHPNRSEEPTGPIMRQASALLWPDKRDHRRRPVLDGIVRTGGNFIYHGPESSTSTEPSPIFEKKSFPRRGRPKMLQLAHYSHETAEPQYQHRSFSGFGLGSQRSSASLSRDSPFLFPSKLEPPTGFSDSVELSEAECDLDAARGVKPSSLHPHKLDTRDFTIAIVNLNNSKERMIQSPYMFSPMLAY